MQYENLWNRQESLTGGTLPVIAIWKFGNVYDAATPDPHFSTEINRPIVTHDLYSNQASLSDLRSGEETLYERAQAAAWRQLWPSQQSR